jgi:hypothetical protein
MSLTPLLFQSTLEPPPPTGVTWNALDKGTGVTLIDPLTTTGDQGIRATLGRSTSVSGKFCFQVICDNLGFGNLGDNAITIGLSPAGSFVTPPAGVVAGCGLMIDEVKRRLVDGDYDFGYGTSYSTTPGEPITMVLYADFIQDDVVNVGIILNGNDLGLLVSMPAPDLMFPHFCSNEATFTAVANFGATAFTKPSGYLAWDGSE